MSYSITIILLGILAIPGMIIAKKPEAKQLLDKITPYTGWAGLLGLIWGVFNLISIIGVISMLTAGLMPMLYWIVALACVICQLVLGLLLGYSLIAEYAFKSDELKAKGAAVLAKLAPVQGKFGIFAIIVGLINLGLFFVL